VRRLLAITLVGIAIAIGLGLWMLSGRKSGHAAATGPDTGAPVATQSSAPDRAVDRHPPVPGRVSQETAGNSSTEPANHRPSATTAAAKKPVSMEDQIASNVNTMRNNKLLTADFDAFADELQAVMAVDRASLELAEAYEEQFQLMLEDQQSKAQLTRVHCGRKLCIAEMMLPPGSERPDLSAEATGRVGAPLAIPTVLTFGREGEPLTTRILFSAVRSPDG
jgi:hypothetical protein